MLECTQHGQSRKLCAFMQVNGNPKNPKKTRRPGIEIPLSPAAAWRFKCYGTARWRRLRATVMQGSPQCAVCREAKATQCDHIVHRPDNSTFWDRSNLRPVCSRCNARLGASARHQRFQAGSGPAQGGGGGQKIPNWEGHHLAWATGEVQGGQNRSDSAIDALAIATQLLQPHAPR